MLYEVITHRIQITSLKMSSNNQKQRINFASIKNQLEYPDFLEVQLKSFQDFFQMDTAPEKRKTEGLYKVFAENFPIADTRNNFILEFLDYYVDPPRYSVITSYSIHYTKLYESLFS